MGEVLSQAQIDALLNNLTGPGDGGNQGDDPSHKAKERRYDFSTPKLFTKERIKLLDSIYTDYARIISSHLSTILRLACDVELVDVEEQKYGEFHNALGDNDILSMLDISLGGNSYEGNPALMKMSNSVVYLMIDRLMGGSGDTDPNVEEEAYTDIELALYESIVLHITPLMNDVWGNYLDANFNFSKVEVNPRLMQLMGMDDVVVILLFNINIKDVNGNISLCLPGSTLETMCKAFESNIYSSTKRRETQSEQTAESIFTALTGSMLEIKVELSEAEVMLSDIYYMQVGDIINLNKPKDSDAVIYVENQPWFSGELGVENKNLAIRINAPVSNS
ncbi:MAG: FliM/FliN family flagellar motor switch protein [Oscillospiraceae bacterium]|nr:FliM/FliN family flagellar motor switch protein [Oscillospiraceae bacterium]